MKRKFNFTHAVIYGFMLLLPAMGEAQTKNVISNHRVFPKMDKIVEFEKALATHAQKYHTGDVAWRVFAIQSGPDAGGFQITEGPTSWEAEDARGNLGEAHTLDWNKNVSVHLTDRQSAGYSVFLDSLSTIQLGDFTDKINIAHVYPKPGRVDEVVKMIKKLKKSWVAADVTVAVYSASSSGKGQFAIVTRYKQGLKERATGFRKPFRQTYDAVNGEGAYDQYLKDISENVEESWSELLFMRKDLSSK